MSYLSKLRRPSAEDEPAVRDWTMLEPEEAIGAPALVASIAYMDPDTWERGTSKYRPRGQFNFGLTWVTKLSTDDRDRLYRWFLKRVLKNLTGLGKLNVARIAPALCAPVNADVLKEMPESFDFSDEFRDELAPWLDFAFFVLLHGEATNNEAFAVALAEKKVSEPEPND